MHHASKLPDEFSDYRVEYASKQTGTLLKDSKSKDVDFTSIIHYFTLFDSSESDSHVLHHMLTAYFFARLADSWQNTTETARPLFPTASSNWTFAMATCSRWRSKGHLFFFRSTFWHLAKEGTCAIICFAADLLRLARAVYSGIAYT